jgi:hypothetical protein
MIFSTAINGPTNGVGSDLGAAADFTKGTDFNCTTPGPKSFCYGIGTANHALFIRLQQEINKFSTKVGFALIADDGKFGSSTVAAAQKAAKFVRKTILTLAADPALQLAAGPGLTTEMLSTKVPALIEAFTSAAAGGPAVAQLPAAATTATAATATAATATTAEVPGESVEPAPAPGGLPPEFAAGMAAIINTCRTNPNDPMCLKARAACSRTLTVPQSSAQAVQDLCAALNAIPVSAPTTTGLSTKTWWIIGGAAAGVVLISVIGIVAYRSGRKRETVAVAGPSRFRRRQLVAA